MLMGRMSHEAICHYGQTYTDNNSRASVTKKTSANGGYYFRMRRPAGEVEVKSTLENF